MGKKKWKAEGDLNLENIEIIAGGKYVSDDGEAVCWKCKGNKGWHMRNNILKHVPCGTIQ